MEFYEISQKFHSHFISRVWEKGKSGNPDRKSFIINKAFDLLIVVVGVTIAFHLGSLKKAVIKKKLKNFYMGSLTNDLDQDLRQYDENLKELLADHHDVYSCLARMEEKEDVRDSLGLVVFNILRFETFEGNRNTYSTILSSNGLSIIQDPFIRNSMLEYYRLYASIERFESNYTNHVSRIHDYFSLYIDYNNSQNIPESDILQNIRTKNLLTISGVELQHGIRRYEESIEKAKILKDRINSYLRE